MRPMTPNSWRLKSKLKCGRRGPSTDQLIINKLPNRFWFFRSASYHERHPFSNPINIELLELDRRSGLRSRMRVRVNCRVAHCSESGQAHRSDDSAERLGSVFRVRTLDS